MLCRVDLADVFGGSRSARWALQFVERCLVHPESVTAAKIRGGEQHWPDWFGWTPTTTRTLQATNIAIAAAGGKRFAEPPAAAPAYEGPATDEQLNAVAAQLMSMI